MSGEEQQIPQPSFSMFISSLSMQALIFLGEIENPMTHKTEKNLDQARYIIDTISLLKDKTKGNLDGEEERILSEVLYDLRMAYVQAAKK